MAAPIAALSPVSAAIASFKAMSVALAAAPENLAHWVQISIFARVFPAPEPWAVPFG